VVCYDFINSGPEIDQVVLDGWRQRELIIKSQSYSSSPMPRSSGQLSILNQRLSS
jgi:hypothetical protein